MPVTDLLVRRATIAPNSVDPRTRTATVVFSTGAPVERRDFEGPYREVLSLAPEAVDLARLKGGPVLNGHRQAGVDSVIGVVLDARTNGREASADIKLSGRAEVEPILRDMADGIVRSVSVGYTVQSWQDKRDPKSGLRTRTATKWTAHEISLVPVGADPGATVRSEQMPQETQTIEAPPANAPETTPANDGGDRAGVDTEIRRLAALANLGDAFANGLVTRQASVEDARTAIFDALAARGGGEIRTAATPSIMVGADYSDLRSRAEHVGEALYLRINPAHKPSEPAREFVGLSIPEIGRMILRNHGISTTGLSPDSVITRALHTTSDFSLILGDTVGRSLRAAYQAAPAGVRQVARQTTARDFRTKHRLQLGEAPTLQKVNESGEFTSGTMAEGEETYALGTYGRIIGISRKALVNDDLGAFADLSARFGVAAAEFEAQFLVDLLTSGSGNGPTLSDNTALFDSTHGNKASSGAAPDETTLSAGRKAMRLQTGLSGKPINVTPRYLLVPAALETTAEKLIATIQAAKTADANVFAGKLEAVTDARLDAKSAARWYLVADPMTADGLEYAYLEGAPGPQTTSRNGFEVDGVETKVWLDFGAGFVDHRSWYMNAGQ